MQLSAHESDSKSRPGYSKDANDRELLESFLLYHDEGALERLVRRHRYDLLNTAYAYMPEIDIASAEELLREVYIRLAEDPRWLEGSISVAAGLRMLLLNIANDRDVKSLRRTDSTPIPPMPLPAVSESSQNPSYSLKAMIEQAIAAIPERPRAVLVLRYEEGLSIPDVAKALKRPLREVRDDFLIGILLVRSELHKKDWRMATGHLLDLLEQTFPVKHASFNLRWVLQLTAILLGGCALVWFLSQWGAMAFGR